MEIDRFYLKDNLPYYDGKLCKVSKNSQGYLRVLINKQTFRLHRLIALKYIPNPKNKRIVDHINNKKSDNRVCNLQWLTHAENSKKAFKDIPSMSNMSKRCNKKDIISICNTCNKKTVHKSLRECAKYLDRNVAAVYRCLNGEWNNCNNHKLMYKK